MPARRRWIGVVVAYVAAVLFVQLFVREDSLRASSFGSALAALFLLAQPAYTVGALFTSLQPRGAASPAAALSGAAFGVLLGALFLIPKLTPGVIFLLAAALLAVMAFLESRRSPPAMKSTAFSLDGKCAIVTGVGDRGQVGFAVARHLSAAGARVCITDFREEVDELARDLGALGVRADLTNEDDVARLVATALEHFGRVDLVVNLAGGLSVIKPLAETSREEWEREVKRNAETAFLVSRAALPALRITHGAIVNFASPAGERAQANLGAYSAAKAAVIALTRAMAIEEKTSGVRVNALAPGMIDTEQNRASAPAGTTFVPRERIAGTVVFLASDEGAAITGETIHVLGEGIE